VGAELRLLLHRAQRKGRSAPVCTVPRWRAALHRTSAARRWPGLRAAKGEGALAPDAEPHTAAVATCLCHERGAPRVLLYLVRLLWYVSCVVCSKRLYVVCGVLL